MDLYTLDADFQPVNLVQNYESLVWAERYSANGDFEIRSSDINQLVSMLPRESYVGLRDSTVPMIVEDHQLVKPLRDKPQVSITGRCMTTPLDRRGSVNQLNSGAAPTAWSIDAVKESDAAYLAMRIVLGDIARTQGGVTVLNSAEPAVSPSDAIPELNLTLPADYFDLVNVPNYDPLSGYIPDMMVRYLGYVWRAKGVVPPVGSGGAEPSSFEPGLTFWERMMPWRPYEIKRQNLYTTVMELLGASRRGIKAVRPGVGGNQVGIEIYNGANLTGEGDTGDPNTMVLIDARFDQIDDATYLLSEQGSTNVGYVYGANGAQSVLKTASGEPSGLARRVLVLDASSDATTTSEDVRKTRGLIELYKHNATALFDGQVAEQVAAGYNRDYFLGDILKLVGEYGLYQNARVAEFIRTEDVNGEKAYPTFEAVDD